MGNESASKEAKLGRYVLIQRSDDKHDLKLEDTTGHAFSNPFNELKTEADREMIEEKCETSKVKQILSCYSEKTNSQIGAKIDFVKEPTAELGQMDKEVVEVLASCRRTRRGKANESNFMKENAMQIQRYTRNSYKALSTNAIENCTDLALMQETNNSASAVETVKKSLRGTSRKHFTATVESVMSNNISHAPELLKPSKEPSDKPYLRRKRAAKPKEPETILGLKEKADAKIPLRNKEDSKSDLKSQFAEENTQDKMQNENFGNLGMENNGNILKRSRRGRNITEQTDIEILNAAVEEDKTGRKKCTASKSYKKRLENNTGEVKEKAVTHLLKGKKVHFLLEKNDALLLQEKSTLGEKGDSRKENNASSTTEQTSRRSKRKISVAPQPVGFSPSKEKQALEINETQYKQDTFFSSENVIAGSDRSGVSFSLGHEECGEKGQNGESPDESQKVQLESVQTPAGRSRPRRQKVEKENIHQRGRGKQAICKEIPTQDSNKKADNTKKHTKKNQTKRGKGRKIDLQLEIPLPLEQNTLERENPKADNLNSAQSECSEQYIQNEPHPNDTQNITLGSAPITAQCDSQKRDEVGKENALRRSKRKVLAHEITENVSQQDVGIVEQNMDIRNKNLPKRTKGRRIVSDFQTLLSLGVSAKEDLEVGKSSSAQEDCSLQQPQNAINPNETQNMPMESVQVLAEQSLPDGLNVPRKGRRKAIAQTTLTEYNSKQAGSTTEEDVVVKSACSAKENQSKRSRTRKIAPASQALISPIQDNLPLQTLTRSKNAEQSSETSETKTTANENRPHRSRRRKADDIITTGSVSASKKPRLPDKSNQEKMPRDIQDVSKESISKRSGRKQLVLQKTLAECNGQLGNNSEKAMPVKDESVPLKKGSGKAKKTKKNKGEQIALESQVSSSLNVSITVPPLSSEKGGSACKNPSTVIENGAVGKARQAKCSSRNKTVVSTTAVRRKYKQTAEEVDHENNLEKTDVANQKHCRSDRKKLVALEATICASVKEKYGLNASSDTASNDLLEILDNNAAKKNPPRRGKRKQVNSDSETSASTSITTRDVILENKLKSKAEDSENTTLQKGKRKMKEEPTRAEETEGRTRGSKRTKK
ncbi:hypothetical protein JRQ81_018342 [Phrynocephalus forsythii]|uniref:Uncharacterized protein n=1 Tax=Phrynocephalus forsythii TaxID=171643 RepID=A0A9Q0XT32_9SAUR|nr:hypothetical protein JRQ81_018342 [Phrynocephalus forsythii]